MNDRTTKILLTLIAGALWLLVAAQYTPVAQAEQYGTKLAEVNVKRIGGMLPATWLSAFHPMVQCYGEDE